MLENQRQGSEESNREQRPVEQTDDQANALKPFNWKMVIRFAIYILIFPATLFLVAGRFDWLMGWLYAAMLVFSAVVSRIVSFFKHPELLAERAQYQQGEGVKAWDRTLVPWLALYGPLITTVLVGLDQRFGWSLPLSPALQWAAALVVAVGIIIATWAMMVNKFFSAMVRIQAERGHAVVTAGPYRLVRHPAYAGAILSNLAMPVMLNSLWALIPATLLAVGTVVRTALEDQTLIAELPGYTQYCHQTRFRLLPGVW